MESKADGEGRVVRNRGLCGHAIAWGQSILPSGLERWASGQFPLTDGLREGFES
jgi:hypothetical protein